MFRESIRRILNRRGGESQVRIVKKIKELSLKQTNQNWILINWIDFFKSLLFQKINKYRKKEQKLCYLKKLFLFFYTLCAKKARFKKIRKNIFKSSSFGISMVSYCGGGDGSVGCGVFHQHSASWQMFRNFGGGGTFAKCVSQVEGNCVRNSRPFPLSAFGWLFVSEDPHNKSLKEKKRFRWRGGMRKRRRSRSFRSPKNMDRKFK